MSHLFCRLRVGKINDYRISYHYPAEVVTWYAAQGLLKEFTGKMCCVKCMIKVHVMDVMVRGR